MLKIKFILLTIIVCFAALPALAWDDAGHKLTSYIAWQQMTPTTRERVIKILRSAPEDSHLSALYPQDSRSEAAKQLDFFQLAAYWADIVRDRNFKTRYEKYHKSDWHYSDTFWRVTNGKVEILENFSEPKGKAVDQLFAFDKLLRDPAATDADKAVAIAWVLHLGGDIHQPLHTSARVTDLEPKGDQGGNLFQLTPQGTVRENQENLHWFWDSIVRRNVPRQADACDSAYLPEIAREMMKKHPLDKMQNRLALGQFNQWQQEGFKIARDELFPATLIRFQMPTEAYKKRAFQISQQQLALAGYRLGAMLNQIFGGQTSAMTTKEQQYQYAKGEAEKSGSTIGTGANDSWIWFKVRSALATADGIRDTTVNVDVTNDVVTLKGTVSRVSEKVKAEQVAKTVEGVKGVKNMLRIVSK